MIIFFLMLFLPYAIGRHKEVLENVYKKVMNKYSKFIFSYSVLEFKNYRGFEKYSYIEAKNKAKQYLTNKDLMQLYKIKEKAQKKGFSANRFLQLVSL